MFGHLVLTLVEIVVGHFHGLDVEQQLFAREQPLIAVQIIELNVGQGGIAQLVLQRALGLFGDLEGQLERLGIERLDVALQEGVEADGRLLAWE